MFDRAQCEKTKDMCDKDVRTQTNCKRTCGRCCKSHVIIVWPYSVVSNSLDIFQFVKMKNPRVFARWL